MNKKDIFTLIFLVVAGIFFSIGWDFLASNSLGTAFLSILAGSYALRAYYHTPISYRTWCMGTLIHIALLWMIEDHIFVTVDRYAGDIGLLSRAVTKVLLTAIPETVVVVIYWKAFRMGCRVKNLWRRVTS